MRIDKFLKNARIIKRRPIAKEACEHGRVLINKKICKPGDEVNVNDEVEINFGTHTFKFIVLDIKDKVSKSMATTLYKHID